MSAFQTRKTRVVILGIVVALILLSTATLAQQGMPGSPAVYNCEPGTASGGAYQLVSVVWQVSGTSSGGDYRLLSPEAPTHLGSGCCCTYLPMSLRNRK